MTAPIRSMADSAEVTSYTELIGVIRTRLGDLGIRYEDFDALAGFAPGLSGKVFGPSQVRRIGPEKMFDAMRAASLKFEAKPDPEQLAKMQKQMLEKCQVRQANQARMGNEASPAGTHRMGRFFRYFAKMGGKARMSKMSKAERSDHQRRAANARWKQERKRRKAAHTRRQRDKERKAREPAPLG